MKAIFSNRVEKPEKFRTTTGFEMDLYAIAKLPFITARIIASLDFMSAVQYMIHFVYHFVR